VAWDINQLFRLHASAIAASLRRRGANADVAEDITQDAFVRVIATPPGEHTVSYNPRGYLFRVSNNLLIDLRRREKALPMVGLDLDDLDRLPATTPSAEVVVYDHQRLALTKCALNELPERTRRAFELHRIEGLTIAEVGLQLNVSTSRAWGLIQEAYQHLRIKLKGV